LSDGGFVGSQQARLLPAEGQPGHGPGLGGAHLVNAALDIHDDDPAFGYRFIVDELSEKGIRAGEGKLYLCAVKDVYSGRIVGYSMDSRMKFSLAVPARRPAGTVVPSNRGPQFRSRRFVESLRRPGITGSRGRVGASEDNAAMESFFSLLQKNVLDRQRWTTRQELRLPITTWIETHHRQRRQRKLTPIEYEQST
jgi:transposase InsO family protein